MVGFAVVQPQSVAAVKATTIERFTSRSFSVG
jgi:hypothetical protein